LIKNKHITFRVTEEEYNKISKKAKQAGMTISRYIAISSLGNTIVSIEGLPDVEKQLIKIGTNLNQAVMLCHQGRITTIALESTREELKKIWQCLNLLTEGIKR
jgi:hypothetical protein